MLAGHGRLDKSRVQAHPLTLARIGFCFCDVRMRGFLRHQRFKKGLSFFLPLVGPTTFDRSAGVMPALGANSPSTAYSAYILCSLPSAASP
jgi:hypothetical protein